MKTKLQFIMNPKTSTNQNSNLLIIAFLLLSSLIFGQTTYVPDDNFENYLETHDANGNVVAVGDPTSMGNGIANDNYVTTAKISGVTHLNVYNRAISNLTGIEDFVALTILNCSENSITSLDVSNATALTLLNCERTSLTSLDISNNIALTSLRCEYTALASLDVSNNTALTYLNCGYIGLTSLDVSNNTALTTLKVHNNSLTSLDVSNNTALKVLGCNDNSLTSLDVSNNPALTTLEVRRNSLTSLNISNNPALTDLDCFYNQLTSLDVSSATALTYLSCSTNSLTSLDVSNNTALTVLASSDNLLTSLDVSNNTALTKIYLFNNSLTSLDVSNNTALIELYCRNNLLTYLNVKNGNNHNMFDVNFQDNPNLICVNVDNESDANAGLNSYYYWLKNATATYGESCYTYIPDNNFEQELIDLGYDIFLDNYVISANINALTTLDISNKNISDLTGIEDFTSLTNLNFQQNNISSVDLSTLTSLTSLDCQNNSLTTLDISNLTNLSVLRCNNNSLSALDVSSQGTNLTRLYCNNNNLTALDVSSNTNLTRLYCNDNGISAFNLSANTLLTQLFTQNNDVVDLDLNPLTSLVHLDTSNNELETLKFAIIDYNNVLTFDSRQNANLTCIEVYNPFHSTTNWTNIDPQTSFSEDCHYDETFVPNDIFEAYLETHDANGNIVAVGSSYSMGNGISNDDYVTTSNINTVTNLNISGLTINDLTGIEDFTALTTLDCSDNLLTLLDVTKNTALTALNCLNNSLTAIDVTQNTALLELFCYNNALSTLDVSLNTVLNTLECSNNQLTQLNVANGNNTNFSIFDAVSNPNLSCIQVDDAAYSTFYWTNIDATASFSTNCHYNETYVPDNNFETYLETHDANGNVVTVGDPTSMGNGIANDDYVTTAKISGITNLDVSNKSISDLTGIEDFVGLENLNCSLNDLSSLDLSNNTSLIVLDCSSNNSVGSGISNLNITNNPNLTTIIANQNNLSLIDLVNKPLLTELDIESNIFTTINVSSLPVLNKLNVSQNQLTYLDVSNNSNLTQLYCYSNLLNGLSVFYNDNLTKLICSGNQINSLVLPQQTGNLIELEFRNNQVSTLDVSAYTQLAILDCSSNVLTQLNVANGNNTNVTNFNATTNPNLTCIQIDNGFTPNASWSKDATASYSFNCNFNETYVPDNNFEAYLEANGMGNGIANDDYVTTSNINTVTSLAINNRNISDLTGIEDFTALENLDCEYNQISTVDFSNNTALVSLYCNNNSISILDLSANTALQTLYCNDNTINDIQLSPGSLVNLYCENNQINLLDLTNFFNLENVHCYNNNIASLDLLNSAGNLIDLQCNDNQLTGIDIDSNINLITFYCGNNQLTGLTLTTNTALEDVRCDNNQLTNLDVTQNTALRVLLVNNNNITNIDIAQNTALTDFFCNNNQLTSLDISQNMALVELRCQNNQITDLVSPSPMLQLLNCSDNSLSNLDVSQNTALLDLQCYGNQLSEIDVSANTQLASFNCSANSLTSLIIKNGNNTAITTAYFDATGNANLTCIEVDDVAYTTANWTNIDAQTSFNLNCHYGETYVPDDNFEQALIDLGYDIVLDDYVITSNISGLTVLDLSSLNISDLTGIEDFVSLVNLNCSANNLTTLDFTTNTALEILYCGANNLTSLDVQSNTALTELIVSQNQLTGIDVIQNVNLLFLACEGNPFNNGLDITQNILLQQLIANSLNLTSLDISQNDDLQTIDCSYNAITDLDFTGKQDLTEIRCQYNQLTDVYLRENPALTFVDVSDNLLTDFTIDNGNNTAILGNSFYATNNSNLTCIQVDNVAYSTTNWTNIDVTAGFSTNCVTFGLTNVPDNNFENYLETHDANGNVVALGSPTSMGNGIANDDYVFMNRINSVTNLDVNSLSISDLTGIEDFIALTFLNCSDNSLTSLDISNNTALTNLSCASNLLTSLNTSNNTALSSLTCANNSLTSINISNNAALLQLSCANNSLTSINVSNNTALTYLNCSFNSLENLNVSNNTALTQIDCFNNSLTSLDVSNLSVLTSLACQNNQLISLNVKNGNNFAFVSFDARTNPNLTCVEVDSVSIPSEPTWQKDITASYSTNCATFVKIWENGVWTNGVPSIANNAIIRDNYNTIIGNIEARTLTIDPTFSVVIFDGDYIKLQSNLINNGDLSIEHQGSFVQVGDNATVTGSGINKVTIKTTLLEDQNRFTYFSSPCANQSLQQIFNDPLNQWANVNRLYGFNVNTQFWEVNQLNDIMIPSEGVAVPPNSTNIFPIIASIYFEGKLNNGIYTQPLIYNPGGFDDDNLFVGNPYPSAIDAGMLLNQNAGANAFYFWTHKSAFNGTHYLADDYAIWNNAGGIASASGSPAPTGFIASGQGFFVEANTISGNFTFDNSMRVTGNNNDFRRTDTSENDKIWINLTNDQSYFNQILVAFIEEGSLDFDPTYDASRINAEVETSFYTIGQQNERFGIESRSVLTQEQTIYLGLTLLNHTTSNFKISIDHFENLEGVTVYLKDNFLNTLHDLTIEDYSFLVTEEGVFNNRFELIFNRNTLSINENLTQKKLIVANIGAEQLQISMSNNSIIENIKIYDVLGRLIIDNKPHSSNVKVSVNTKKATILLINVTLENGEVYSKKIIRT